MRGKKFSSPRDTNNSDAIVIKNVIQEIAQEEIKKFGFPTYKAAIVRKLNDDGTVDCYLPPNEENLVTGILNKSGELLFVGDSVELETKNGSLTNCWVAIKHGTNVQGQAAEVATLSGEVVMKVQNGRLSVTELNRDANLGNAFTIIAEDINLDGMNIVLNGARGITITSPYFNVTNQGYITATGGKIGGWNLGNTRLYSGSGANYVALDSGTQGVDYPIWAGNENPANAPFSVTRGGAIKSTSGSIGGWSISSNALYTSNNNLYLGTSGITATIGGTSRNNLIFKAGSNFGVDTSGNLYANSANLTSATVSGDITATAGTIGGCAITNGALSVDNAHIASLDAGKINTGTISADRIGANSITAGKLNVSTLSAISSNLGTITGGSISIGGYFSVSSSGLAQLSNSVGYLTMNLSTHPYVSALNVAHGMGGGISFRTSQNASSVGSQRSYINQGNSTYTYQLNIYGYNGIDMGTSGAGSIYCYNRVALSTGSQNYCWADGGGTGEGKIKTTAGDSSSRNLKENFVEFTDKDYNQAYKFLKEMKLHEYDYKYQIYEDKHQYGFIIDELEELENCDKFFRFSETYAKVQGDKLKPSLLDGEDFDENDEDIIKYKEYNSDVLDKFMLTCLKAMQNKIEEQDKEIKELKNIIKNIAV